MNVKKELSILRTVAVICAFFGLTSVVFAILSGSTSMLLDGLYSLLQCVFILVSCHVVRMIGREDDDTFQFGYGSFEPFFIMLRTTSIITLYLALGHNAVKDILLGGYDVNASIAMVVTGVSVFVCLAVAFMLSQHAKRLKSPIMKAEARSWVNDSIISIAVLFAFLLMKILKSTGHDNLARYIDPSITLLYVVLLIPGLIKQLITSARELLFAAPSDDVQQKLDEIILSYKDKYDFVSYDTYAAKLGRTLNLTVYVKLKKDYKISELDVLRSDMLKAIQNEWPYVDSDIVFTIDDSWIKYSMPKVEE